MRKTVIIRAAAAILAAVLFYPAASYAESAKSAIVIDGQTGRVFYEKQADDPSLIASTTKIMTALLVCEQCNVLDVVRIPKEAVGIEGSSMYLQEGEVVTVQDLLYGLMLASGNDAAMALAIYCGGTVEGFVAMMNDKARMLQLENTYFENPHGLDGAAHHGSARDLAKLAAYAMKNPLFAQTVATKKVSAAGRYFSNHNKLLWQVEGADGVKTGYTKAAGRILVSSAVRQGRRLICVTIHDPNDWQDHAALYAQYFPLFSPRRLITAGDRMGSLPVFGGQIESVDVIAAENFDFSLADGERVTFVLSQKGFAYAPVVRGSDGGYVYICVDGHTVGKVQVTYQRTVEQFVPNEQPFWQKIFGGKK